MCMWRSIVGGLPCIEVCWTKKKRPKFSKCWVVTDNSVALKGESKKKMCSFFLLSIFMIPMWQKTLILFHQNVAKCIISTSVNTQTACGRERVLFSARFEGYSAIFLNLQSNVHLTRQISFSFKGKGHCWIVKWSEDIIGEFAQRSNFCKMNGGKSFEKKRRHF